MASGEIIYPGKIGVPYEWSVGEYGSRFFYELEKQIRTGRPFLPSGPLSSTGYFNPVKNHSNRKKRFVKNPLSAVAFGQNKTLTPCQNNVVINRSWYKGNWLGPTHR